MISIYEDINFPTEEPEDYYGYIYLTTNNINGMKYVGQKTGKFNPNYIGSGFYQWNDIRENGYKKSDMTVQVIEYVYSREEITRRENYWIKTLDAIHDPMYYNAVYGGNHPNVIHHSEETKQKLRDSSSGRIVLNKDGHERRVKKDDTETIEQLLSDGWEYGLCRKLDNPTKGKFGKDNPHYGMKRSDVTRQNISNAKKGKPAWNKGKSTIMKGSKHMYNPETKDHKMVRPEDIEYYQSIGYIFGRG